MAETESSAVNGPASDGGTYDSCADAVWIVIDVMSNESFAEFPVLCDGEAVDMAEVEANQLSTGTS
jgi:hypothetical protein